MKDKIRQKLKGKKKLSTFKERSDVYIIIRGPGPLAIKKSNQQCPPRGPQARRGLRGGEKPHNLKRVIKLKSYGIITIDKRLNSPLAHSSKS